MIPIRPAVENDIEALCSFDLIAHRENERREFIHRVVTSGECFVAVADEKVIGYGVLNYTFYCTGWIVCFTFIPITGEAVRVRRCCNIWSRSAEFRNYLLRRTFQTCRCNRYWQN